MKISASILTADFARLESEVQRVEQAGVEMLHVDVMDGIFVPNISIGLPVLECLRKLTDMHLDVHLMIDKPERYIERFAWAGADTITFHVEATDHVNRVIQSIKDFGIRAGVALNPGTGAESLEWLVNDADMILQMTVNPGFGGQKYISGMTDKIKRIREIAVKRGADVDIQVDGGINVHTIGAVHEAGADIAVVGAALFGSDDMEKAVSDIRGKLL